MFVFFSRHFMFQMDININKESRSDISVKIPRLENRLQLSQMTLPLALTASSLALVTFLSSFTAFFNLVLRRRSSTAATNWRRSQVSCSLLRSRSREEPLKVRREMVKVTVRIPECQKGYGQRHSRNTPGGQKRNGQGHWRNLRRSEEK